MLNSKRYIPPKKRLRKGNEMSAMWIVATIKVNGGS
jgi:hypothetical protein